MGPERTNLESHLRALDRELIETCRLSSAPVPEGENPETYAQSLAERVENLSEELQRLNFAQSKFAPHDAIYSQSQWKYLGRLGAALSDHRLEDSEALELHSLAAQSSDLGVRFLFRQLVTAQPIHYRWGGFDDEACVDDRHVTSFEDDEAGGVKLNLSDTEEALYTNRPGFFDVSYDPLQTVVEQPYGVEWEHPSLRDLLAVDSKLWIESEATRNPSDLLGNTPEAFLFSTGGAKAAVLEDHLRLLRENITNTTLVQQEINFIFSNLLHPDAVYYTAFVVLVQIASANTIDRATQYLYIHFLEEAIAGEGGYQGRMRLFSENFGSLNGEGQLGVSRPIALALRQDTVAVHALLQNELYSIGVSACGEEPLGTCSDFQKFKKKLTAQFLSFIPDQCLSASQGKPGPVIEAWAQESAEESLKNGTPSDLSLLAQLPSSHGDCQKKCDSVVSNQNLGEKGKSLLMPQLAQTHDPNKKQNPDTIQKTFEALSFVFAMLADMTFFEPTTEARGFGPRLKGALRQYARFVGTTAMIYSFGLGSAEGFRMLFLSPEKMIEALENRKKAVSLRLENGDCDCR